MVGVDRYPTIYPARWGSAADKRSADRMLLASFFAHPAEPLLQLLAGAIKAWE